jgi:hypothetical protein
MKIIIQRYTDSTCAKERCIILKYIQNSEVYFIIWTNVHIFTSKVWTVFISTTINLNKQGNFKIIKFALLILEVLFLFLIWAVHFWPHSFDHLVKVLVVSVFQSLASVVFTFDFLSSQPVEYMTNVVGVVIDLKQGNVSTSNRNFLFITCSYENYSKILMFPSKVYFIIWTNVHICLNCFYQYNNDVVNHSSGGDDEHLPSAAIWKQ